jgi:hypothetical protein
MRLRVTRLKGSRRGNRAVWVVVYQFGGKIIHIEPWSRLTMPASHWPISF